MTIEEFDNTSFGAGDKAIYNDEEYLIASVDFDERLIALDLQICGSDPDDFNWVRCENIKYIPS